MQNTVVTQSLFALLIAAFVVFRFAIRELKPRVIKGGVLWIRPLIIAALTVWPVWTTIILDPAGISELVVALVVGAVVGAITGILIVRYTTFAPAAVPNAVIASGSRVTFAIWIVAFAIRFLARFVVPHGADPRDAAADEQRHAGAGSRRLRRDRLRLPSRDRPIPRCIADAGDADNRPPPLLR